MSQVQGNYYYPSQGRQYPAYGPDPRSNAFPRDFDQYRNFPPPERSFQHDMNEPRRRQRGRGLEMSETHQSWLSGSSSFAPMAHGYQLGQTEGTHMAMQTASIPEQHVSVDQEMHTSPVPRQVSIPMEVGTSSSVGSSSEMSVKDNLSAGSRNIEAFRDFSSVVSRINQRLDGLEKMVMDIRSDILTVRSNTDGCKEHMEKLLDALLERITMPQ